MRALMPHAIGVSGAKRIGNGVFRIVVCPLRHRHQHGPVRCNGGRIIGANTTMRIMHGGIDVYPRLGLCALRHQGRTRSAWGCQRSFSSAHMLVARCKQFCVCDVQRYEQRFDYKLDVAMYATRAKRLTLYRYAYCHWRLWALCSRSQTNAKIRVRLS